MRVVFLGTGGYHPNERRHTACVMAPEANVILDAGTSFFRVPGQLRSPTIDIFLTHAHLDHIAGLTFFLVPMLKGEVRQARVHANRATLDAVREHLFSQPLFPVLPAFEFVELTGPAPVGASGRLTFQPLPSHPGGSTAFRIDWTASGSSPAKSLAYVTDTTTDGSYLDFIRGVDLLIHECYFPDAQAEWAPRTGHSHTTPVAQAARDAGVKRLALVHIDPQRPDDDPVGLEVAQAIFPATFLAEDLMEVEI